jgi:hypothetical protein
MFSYRIDLVLFISEARASLAEQSGNQKFLSFYKSAT